MPCLETMQNMSYLEKTNFTHAQGRVQDTARQTSCFRLHFYRCLKVSGRCFPDCNARKKACLIKNTRCRTCHVHREEPKKPQDKRAVGDCHPEDDVVIEASDSKHVMFEKYFTHAQRRVQDTTWQTSCFRLPFYRCLKFSGCLSQAQREALVPRW